MIVVTKIDRPGSRPGWVVDQTFDLFDKLGATDEQLDFPVLYASALQGWASLDPTRVEADMSALFEAGLRGGGTDCSTASNSAGMSASTRVGSRLAQPWSAEA